MDNILEKSGFLVFKPNLLAKRIEAKHTIVAAGSSRGGTSVVSYALARAGFFLGPTANAYHEDMEILKAIKDKASLRKIFAERNLAHDVWGFKIPLAAFYFDWLDMELRNTVFIYVMRNPASIAKSIMTRDPVYGSGIDGFVGALNHSLRYYVHFTETLRRLRSPVILVEYEAVIRAPLDFCNDFYACLGIKLEEACLFDIAQQLSEPGYKDVVNQPKE